MPISNLITNVHRASECNLVCRQEQENRYVYGLVIINNDQSLWGSVSKSPIQKHLTVYTTEIELHAGIEELGKVRKLTLV